MKCLRKFRLRFKIILLSTLLILSWSALTVPIILFHFPYKVEDDTLNKINISNEKHFSIDDKAAQNIRHQNVHNLLNRNHSTSSSTLQLNCSGGFYRDNGSNLCLPSCSGWNQYDSRENYFSVISIATVFISITAAMIAIIYSCFKHSKLLKFPNIFIVYWNVDVACINLFVLIAYFGANQLLCSSRNIYDSLQRSTPYCILTALVFQYVYHQYILWWILHLLGFFWSVYFPFHFRCMENAGKTKYVHILFLIIGLTVPLISIGIVLTGNYVQSIPNRETNYTDLSEGAAFQIPLFPGYRCSGRDISIDYYANLLILNILIMVGVTLFILIVWRIVMTAMKKPNIQEPVKVFHFGILEIKLLIFSIYTAILTVTYTIYRTLYLRDSLVRFEEFNKFFNCEKDGNDPNSPCDRSGFEILNYRVISLLSFIALAFEPIFKSVIYLINFNEMKKIALVCMNKMRKDTQIVEMH